MKDTTLRKALDEIKRVFKKYDIGGVVAVSSTEEHAGRIYLEDPSWSCVRSDIEDTGEVQLMLDSNEADKEADVFCSVEMIRNQSRILDHTQRVLQIFNNEIAKALSDEHRESEDYASPYPTVPSNDTVH